MATDMEHTKFKLIVEKLKEGSDAIILAHTQLKLLADGKLPIFNGHTHLDKVISNYDKIAAAAPVKPKGRTAGAKRKLQMASPSASGTREESDGGSKDDSMVTPPPPKRTAKKVDTTGAVHVHLPPSAKKEIQRKIEELQKQLKSP